MPLTDGKCYKWNKKVSKLYTVDIPAGTQRLSLPEAAASIVSVEEQWRRRRPALSWSFAIYSLAVYGASLRPYALHRVCRESAQWGCRYIFENAQLRCCAAAQSFFKIRCSSPVAATHFAGVLSKSADN